MRGLAIPAWRCPSRVVLAGGWAPIKFGFTGKSPGYPNGVTVERSLAIFMNRPTPGRSHQSADRPFDSTDCNSQIRMTNDEIRRNHEIRMTKPATAQLRVFRHSGFGFLSSFVIRHSTSCASQVHGPNACGKNERGLCMNQPTPRLLPGGELAFVPVRSVPSWEGLGVGSSAKAKGLLQ